MSYRVICLSVAVVCIGVLAVCGCRRGPTRVQPPGIDASAAGRLAIEKYDTDKDGVIKGAELDKAPALKAAIKRLDGSVDGKVDGGVSADEVTARIRKWQESKLGKMSLVCTVYRRGQPLVGATVKFVPEDFLGPNLQTATGTSAELGIVELSAPTDPNNPNDVPGVPCGFYRVEITKQGENIPAIYNTQTTLGEEIAMDTDKIEQGIRYDLK